MRTIKIGTRGSKLALFQAHYVSNLLQNHGVSTDIVVIETKGDKVLDVAISKIGSKGVFTEEIEEQLAKGTIDIAVHSAKDMQSNLPEGFELIAFTEREKVNDVILSHKIDINYQTPGQNLVFGTSSTRRIATLKYYYPHIKTVDIRGNLQTRVTKMKNGHCDAVLLAYAGVHRMGYDAMIAHELSVDEFTPAVGQGSIAVEAHESLPRETKELIKSSVHHSSTGDCLSAERAYLKIMEGGCSIPIFALAVSNGKEIQLKGGIISLNGAKRICERVSGINTNSKELGKKLAEKVIAAGGKTILEEIKQAQGK
ncbi:hydroxymethylbilane synthase [Pleomorphovibrio marinus]|uniref:hydroxymethylbilane synthase n=1 Tax=Pleomorphovibrio marinus TaxID=2164132 RepID=UPI000E0B85EB|nr:hydroxymethylbilane synthase [Pleomorphovibrio marinus]